MRQRTKLTIAIGATATLAAIAMFAWGSAGRGASAGESSTAQYAIVLVFALAMIWVVAAWIAQLLTNRMKHLVEEANKVVHAGVEQEIEIPGRDEVAEMAALFNRVAGEWIQGVEARSKLVSDAAHELRTPVAILRGHLETMLRGAMDLKRENLVSLLDETKRMSRLIQELQQLSLAEAGKLRLDRAWIGMTGLIREVVDIFSVEAEEKQIDLTLEANEEYEAYCDASRMKQTLINLIGNAIRYTPEGGRVDIRQTLQRDGYIWVEIEDTGPGIAADKLPYIFNRFYRADEARSRSEGGTGLGLAIAKQFIEAHGGSLSVASEEGKGTRFMLQLPVFPQG